MDLIDRVRNVAERVAQHRALTHTTIATQNALVMPFIAALGYDVFDPSEVVPGLKVPGGQRGDACDYALMIGGQPLIVFACRSAGSDLGVEPPAALRRGFAVLGARVGVVTNGVAYRFHSDLDVRGTLDPRPFLRLDLEGVRAGDAVELGHVAELERLTKWAFDLDALLTSAQGLKCGAAIKGLLAEELRDPSDELLEFVSARLQPGRPVTPAALRELRHLVPRALRELIGEQIRERLQRALASDAAAEQPIVPERTPASETEQLKRTGFRIVQSIVQEVVAVSRVTMRDTKTYCSVLLDDNNRRPICRLRFHNPERLVLGLIGPDKQEERVPLATVDDLFAHAARLKERARSYDAPPAPQAVPHAPDAPEMQATG